MPRTLVLIGIAWMLLATACAQSPAPALPTLQTTAEMAPSATPRAASVPIPTPIPAAVAPPALIRLIHAATDAPTLTLYAGFNAIATNLSAGQSTDPTPLAAGDYTLRALPSGSNSNDTPLAEMPLQLKGGESLLIIVTGDAQSIQIRQVPETQIALNAGESALTLVNVIRQPIRIQNAETLIVGDTQPDTSANSGILAPGDTILSIRSAEATLGDVSLRLDERRQEFLIVAGTPERITTVTFQVAAPGRTSLRIINAAVLAQPLNIYLSGAPIISGAAYGRPTPRVDVNSGSHVLNLFPVGADGNTLEPLSAAPVDLPPGNVTLVLVGEAADLRAVAFPDDLTATEPGKARIAFITTLPQFPSVILEAGSSGLPGINQLVYGDTPRSTVLDAAPYSLTFISSTQTVEVVENIILEAGRSYLYLVTGRLDNTPLVISESVGQIGDQTNNNVPSSVTAQVRFINAVPGQAVQFSIGQNAQPTVLASGSGSPFVALAERSVTVSAERDGGLIASSDVTFEAGGRYTTFLYQANNETLFLITRDNELLFQDSAPHIRFINLSSGADQSVGLAFAEGMPGTKEPQPVTTPDVGTEGGSTLPFGAQQVLTEQRGGTVSNPVLMPEGVFTFFVTASDSPDYRESIGPIELVGRAAADLVFTSVGAFTIPYPPISD